MPGSIHVSVTERTETTPRGPISNSYSIKVSVGKNEYQSVGREDFFFPVTSIRDNLVIILCDSRGNSVTKKEVKTIAIAEKGDAEIVFPFKLGGDLKLRLSFVLNEEEKEKIREMRSSVLKRKHEELIKGTNDIFSSGTSLQNTSKDHSKLSNQKMPKASTESNRNIIEEHGPPHITKEKKKVSFLIVSQSVNDLTGTDNKKSTPSVPNRTPSDSIKKMISAFERNAKQNSGSQISPRTRTRVNKIDSQTSAESMPYENEDIKERRVSQTLIRRSFSAGDLTEAILQNDPNYAQTPQFNETFRSVFSERSVEVNMENRETNLLRRNIIRNQQKEGGLPNKVIDQTLIYVSDEKAKVNIENMTLNLLQKSVVRNQHNEGGWSNKVFEGTLVSASDEKVKVNMENRDMNMLQRSVVRNQRKEGHLSNKAFDVDIFPGTSHYRDRGVSRYINELSSIDRTGYLFEISDMLMPHHLCITSAPKKVRNFLENFTTSSMHNEKMKLHGTASDEVQEEIGSRNRTDDTHSQKVGSSILNGWLIEQVSIYHFIPNFIPVEMHYPYKLGG